MHIARGKQKTNVAITGKIVQKKFVISHSHSKIQLQNSNQTTRASVGPWGWHFAGNILSRKETGKLVTTVQSPLNYKCVRGRRKNQSQFIRTIVQVSWSVETVIYVAQASYVAAKMWRKAIFCVGRRTSVYPERDLHHSLERRAAKEPRVLARRNDDSHRVSASRARTPSPAVPYAWLSLNTRAHETAVVFAYVCHRPASDSFPSFAITSRQPIVIIERNWFTRRRDDSFQRHAP